MQHQARVRHINRFYLRLGEPLDIQQLLTDLRRLKIYARYHFGSEESLVKMTRAHSLNNASLIAELELLKKEVVEGKAGTSSLNDYFDYGLCSHIWGFDIVNTKFREG